MLLESSGNCMYALRKLKELHACSKQVQRTGCMLLESSGNCMCALSKLRHQGMHNPRSSGKFCFLFYLNTLKFDK